jgi:pyrroloquinoline quinone biosynthesis protein B
MRWIALDGHHDSAGPWRGSLVLRGDDGEPGVLLDPTGAVASRLDADPALCRSLGLDHPTRAVVLTAARLEQVAALIGLRHGAPIDLYTTPAIFEDLSQTLPVLPELQQHCDVHWRMVPVAGDQASAEFHVVGQATLAFTAVASRSQPGVQARHPVLGGPAVALACDDLASGRRAVWLRGRHRFGFGTGALLEGAWLVGVAPDDDDPDDSLEQWLADLPAPRKLMLGGRRDRARSLACLGIELAHDRLEIQI